MNKKEERPVLAERTTPIYIVEYVEYPEKKLKWGIKNKETCRWIIENNPRCPKCNEKLEQKEHYLWYEWICNNPNCNYNTYRTWNHKTILRYKAEKLIKNKKS